MPLFQDFNQEQENRSKAGCRKLAPPLMLNANNPVITGLMDKSEEGRATTIQQIYDLAQLSKNLLKGKELSEFVKRNMEKL